MKMKDVIAETETELAKMNNSAEYPPPSSVRKRVVLNAGLDSVEACADELAGKRRKLARLGTGTGKSTGSAITLKVAR